QWTMQVVPAAQTAAAPAYQAVFGKIPFGHGEKPAAASAAVVATAAAPRPAGSGGFEALDRFDVLGTAGGYLGRSDFLTFVRNAETGVKARGPFEGRGPLAIL